MKRFFVLLAATVILMFSFTSCLEDCEINKTGEVTVTNNTGETVWFDVTNQSGDTNENRQLAHGASSTYTVDAGSARVWVSETNNNVDFWHVANVNVEQCGNASYNLEDCVYFNDGTVEIFNSTGYYIEVAISPAGSNTVYDDIVELEDGDSVVFYYIPAEEIRLWINIPYITDGWSWEPYTLKACEYLEWEWTYSKYQQGEKSSEKPTKNLIQRDRKPAFNSSLGDKR